MYICKYISILNKQLGSFVTCFFIYHDDQKGEKLTNFSQGFNMTVQTTVSLPFYFTGIRDCSDTTREQSDFRQFIYSFVWIKEGHVANVPQDLPCLLSSFVSLHSATPAFSPSFQRLEVFFFYPGAFAQNFPAAWNALSPILNKTPTLSSQIKGHFFSKDLPFYY